MLIINLKGKGKAGLKIRVFLNNVPSEVKAFSQVNLRNIKKLQCVC